MTAGSVIAEEPRQGSDFAALRREIAQAGLLERKPHRYLGRVVLTLIAFAAGWVGFSFLGQSWWQLAIAAFLGLMFAQLGFLGHDAGHRQIFQSRRLNTITGLLHGNLLIGLSFGWWVSKHNRHHAHPNHLDKDPDVAPGAVVFAAQHARRHHGALARFIHRYQAYLFLPMLLLEGLNLHIASVQALRARPMPTRPWETALLLAHLGGYLTAVLLVLHPWQAVAFIAVQQGLFGLSMGLAFAPNHKGMPLIGPNNQLDFLRRQVLTTRNVRGGWFVDNALGGLNYQIEHHLFPSMPRPNLRHAQPIVAAFCARHGIPHLQTGLLTSYRQALQHLHQASAPLRA
ncbi:MAG TPA: acyl-CoA desaturase [Arthrobacter sp.]|nr:acyl-CoA desaturase [Arthrobacter sp.]